MKALLTAPAGPRRASSSKEDLFGVLSTGVTEDEGDPDGEEAERLFEIDPEDLVLGEWLYSDAMLVALGLVTVGYSRLEATAAELLGSLISPHGEIGTVVTTRANLSWVLERTQALVEARVESPSLRLALAEWVTTAKVASEARNRVVHGTWYGRVNENPLVRSARFRRHSELETTFEERTEDQIRDVARALASAADAGMHIYGKLAASGFVPAYEVQLHADGNHEVRKQPPQHVLRPTGHPAQQAGQPPTTTM